MNPKRIQLSRKKGWRMPPNTVKVDRTTPYGNPFRVDKVQVTSSGTTRPEWCIQTIGGMSFYPTKQEALAASVEAFKCSQVAELIRRAPKTLRGKHLACWCKIGTPCHADVLLEIANS